MSDKKLILPSLEASDKKEIKKFNETGKVGKGLLYRFDQTGKFKYYIDTYDSKEHELRSLVSKIKDYQLPKEEISSINKKGENVLHTGFYSESESDGGDGGGWDIIEGPVYSLSKTLKFPNATNITRINAESAETLELPKLTVSGSIYANSIRELTLPEITEIQGNLTALACKKLVAPKLKKVWVDISIRGTERVELTNLEEVECFSVTPIGKKIDFINLPSLKKAKEIHARDVLEFTAVNLESLRLGIVGTSLTKLTIPKNISTRKIWVSDSLLQTIKEERKK
jgi:hypothetical protein